MYDFHARLYDAAIGRTSIQDPLSEKFSTQSPYSFFNNNPLFFTDPTGMEGERFDGVTYRGGHWSDSMRNENYERGSSNNTPPDDITIGKDGVVTKVVKNDKPNRFFDEDGQQLRTNDPKFDNEYLAEDLSVGDQVYTHISGETMLSMLMKAGIMPHSGTNIISRYFMTALNSHGMADFGYNQIMRKFGKNYAYTEYGGGSGNGTFYRFGNSNILYNLGDAGNFAWGMWMRFNNYSYTEVVAGSKINNFFSNLLSLTRTNGWSDSDADQRAIYNGFYFIKK